MFICDSRLHCDFSLGVRMPLPQRMLEICFMDAPGNWTIPKVRPGQEVGYVICNTGRSCYKFIQIKLSRCHRYVSTSQRLWISRIRNICKIQHSKSLTAGANLLAERARDPHDLEMDRCSMYSHFDFGSMRMWPCFIPFHISLRTRTWPWMYNGTRNSRQFFGGFCKAMDIRWVVGSLH